MCSLSCCSFTLNICGLFVFRKSNNSFEACKALVLSATSPAKGSTTKADPAEDLRGTGCRLRGAECTIREEVAEAGVLGDRIDAARVAVTTDTTAKEATRPANAEEETVVAAAPSSEEGPSVTEVAAEVDTMTGDLHRQIAVRTAKILIDAAASGEVTVPDAAVFPTTAITHLTTTTIASTDFETAARRAAEAARASEVTTKPLPEVLVGRAKVRTRKTA